MMDHKTDKLVSAIGDIDTVYLEEVLDFDGANAGRKKIVRFPKLSAACVAVLIILGISVTAFAISRIPLSWRDIFSPSQTVIGDEDEKPVISRQRAAATEELRIKVEKVISDERTLYLLYSVKANDGAVLDQKGIFADFELYFPGQMMSGAYVSQFLERKEGVPENELEGVVYADWQPGDSANGLVIALSNWQEEKWFDDVKVDFNVAEMVAAGRCGCKAALRRIHLQCRLGGWCPPVGHEGAGGLKGMVIMGEELVFPRHTNRYGHLSGFGRLFQPALCI